MPMDHDSAQTPLEAGPEREQAACVSDAEAIAAAAEKAGEAIAQNIEKRQRRRRRRTLLIKIGLVIALLIVLLVALWPGLSKLLAPRVQAAGLAERLPASLQELLPDEVLDYNRFDLQNAVLGEARKKQALVVLEQDVQVDSQISQALANIAIFEKTKTVHSAGTGVYTVDLSRISRRKVKVDMEQRTVQISVPRSELSYIVIDPEQTVFEETEKAFLAFGEIKLTPEQQQILETSVKNTMEGFLTDPAQKERADRAALEQVGALFTPVIQSVAEGFDVSVVME